jgi:Ras-related protein Rab-7A
VKNQFSQQYKATIGADFLTKNIEKGENTLQLQIWDTAGTERYNSMGQSFYRN